LLQEALVSKELRVLKVIVVHLESLVLRDLQGRKVQVDRLVQQGQLDRRETLVQRVKLARLVRQD
jgi:hypothetical protein